jgi:hypothetical protein
VRWADATAAIGLPELRVHDLRHTAASIWLGPGADPKVVQRVLGHASAAMTMDLYGHMIDDNLWTAAKRLGDSTGTGSGVVCELQVWTVRACDLRVCVEPPVGIEPTTFSLRGVSGVSEQWLGSGRGGQLVRARLPFPVA